MYGGGYGRFTSPDPMLSSGRMQLPQSWNRYTYCLNNPLIFVDPLGLYEFGTTFTTEAQKDYFRSQMKEMWNRVKAIKKTYGKKSDEYKEASTAYESYGCKDGKCTEDGAGKGKVVIEIDSSESSASAKRINNDKKVQVTLNDKAVASGRNLVDLIAHEG